MVSFRGAKWISQPSTVGKPKATNNLKDPPPKKNRKKERKGQTNFLKWFQPPWRNQSQMVSTTIIETKSTTTSEWRNFASNLRTIGKPTTHHNLKAPIFFATRSPGALRAAPGRGALVPGGLGGGLRRLLRVAEGHRKRRVPDHMELDVSFSEGEMSRCQPHGTRLGVLLRGKWCRHVQVPEFHGMRGQDVQTEICYITGVKWIPSVEGGRGTDRSFIWGDT